MVDDDVLVGGSFLTSFRRMLTVLSARHGSTMSRFCIADITSNGSKTLHELHSP